MDSKVLARTGAAVFVGLAVAMTLVQLREEPAEKRRRFFGVEHPDAYAAVGDKPVTSAPAPQSPTPQSRGEN